MTRDLVERLGDALSRRSFLRRVAVAAAGVIGLLYGSAGTVEALYSCGCCWLCKPCNYNRCTGCACTWSWVCVDQSSRFWRCHECHGDTSYCGSDCRNVVCSQAQLAGDSPELGLLGA